MSRRKKAEPETVIVGESPPPPPSPPVVERLPERYQLNTVTQHFGSYPGSDRAAILNRAEAEELFEGLIEALYPMEYINGEA